MLLFSNFCFVVLLNMWHKGRTYKHISVTREQHFPPLRLNTTAEVVHKCRELKLDPDHELWKMLLVGSPANAFDPDLCHSLAKIWKHWLSNSVHRVDAKFCSWMKWPELQSLKNADTMSLQTLQVMLLNTHWYYKTYIALYAQPLSFFHMQYKLSLSPVLFQAFHLHTTPKFKCGWIASELTCLTVMLKTLAHQWRGRPGQRVL